MLKASIAAALMAIAGASYAGNPTLQEQADQSPCAIAAAQLQKSYQEAIAAGKTITDEERHALLRQVATCQK